MQALKIVTTKNMSREDWLAARKTGIGGSEMAAVVGVNPWKTAIDVFLDKSGIASPEPENERMYWGSKLEELVAKEFAARHKADGWRVQRNNHILQHPEHPEIIGNVDREVYLPNKEKAVLEIKTTSAFNTKAWEDGVPDWVMVQVQHYLSITGYKKAFVAVLIGGQEYREFIIDRNQELIDLLTKEALSFWEMVQNGSIPYIDGSESAGKLLDHFFPAKAGEAVDLPPEAGEWIKTYEQAGVNEKQAKEAKDNAKNHLRQLLGGAETGFAGEKKVSYKSYLKSKFDTKRFKAENPDLYEKYSTEKEEWRFNIK